MPARVPEVLAAWMRPFRGYFTTAVWRHTLVLVAGALLAPGRRTVTTALRVIPNPVDAGGEWRDGVGCSDASPSIGCSPEHGGAGPALSSGPAAH